MQFENGVRPGEARMKWKVAIVGPAGAAVNTPAFDLLYSFHEKEEAEAHAACFQTVAKVSLDPALISSPVDPDEPRGLGKG